MSDPLYYRSATELANLVRKKEISAVELMRLHLDRIHAVNPSLNAIVTLDEEGALARAELADQRQQKGEVLGPLHGLPIAHKDLLLTKGMRTTMGSPIFRDFIPQESHLLVEREWGAGAIPLGKTNTPEFGAGSQTFNTVFGATYNPYNRTKTCGGSSGGAAVALATGMVPLADGSDLAASLRNPANFCNVVGMRPSVGRVPTFPSRHVWADLGVEGPMGRTVEDVALLLSVQSGYDPRVPISLSGMGDEMNLPLSRDFRKQPPRVAFSPDFGGQMPFEPAIPKIIEPIAELLVDLGCQVDRAVPDFAGADEVFRILRAQLFDINLGTLMAEHRSQMKETVVWNITQGQRQSSSDITRALHERTLIYQRVAKFFETYEFLVLPVNQVLPFSIDQEYVREINGQKMENYLTWMKSCYCITLIGHPAISLPFGFTEDGLPVGIQIVGRARADHAVLQLAYAREQITRTGQRRPNDFIPLYGGVAG